MHIYIASNNAGKIAEFKALLNQKTVYAAKQIAKDFNPDESADSFEANAIIKAKALAAYAPKDSLVIADDSGLCVEALNGAPGVHSARYAYDCGMGEASDDKANKTALKEALKKLNLTQSKAYFVCALALIKNDKITTISAKLDGIVSINERGENGFGYDSMFYPNGLDKASLAELSKEEKNLISHRAKALKKLAQTIKNQLKD